MALSGGRVPSGRHQSPAELQDMSAESLLRRDEADELVEEERHRRHERWKRKLLALLGRRS